MASRPPFTASRFHWLHTVDASFERMLLAIQHAQHSVRLEMYIFTASPIGERFRDALTRACERGVRVRVLVDAWGSLTVPDSFWGPLRSAGGEFRWFNPLSLDRPVIRDHRKLLVCDESAAFVGGFNIAEEYQGDGVTIGWRDIGVTIHGGLAQELAASFDTLFALADFRHKRFIRLRNTRSHHRVSAGESELLLSGPGRGRNYLKKAILNDLRRAASVRIMSAYFLPTRPIRRALMRVARRGGQVQLILAGKSDVPITQLASRRFYQGFLRAGIEIYEYQPQILHAKLLILDHAVYVGSANLDRRSFYINYELMVRVADRPIAHEAQRTFETDLALCQRIEPATWRSSRTFWNKLKERWAYFLLARVDPFIARRQLRHLR